MYIHRPLLLIFVLGIIFMPAGQEWAVSGGTSWYRAQLIWAILIGLAYWNSRRGKRDDF